MHQQQQSTASGFYHHRCAFRLNWRLPEWRSAAALMAAPF
jgi:hypothetical protein